MTALAKKIGFFTAFIIPALVITGFYLGGYWNFLALAFSFLILPLIDQSLGLDTANVYGEEARRKAEHPPRTLGGAATIGIVLTKSQSWNVKDFRTLVSRHNIPGSYGQC